MKISFDKKGFVKMSQENWHAPQYDKLREGDMGEWLMAALFVPFFGWYWYPLVAIINTKVQFS